MFWNLCIYTRVIFNLIHFVYVLHIFTILISEWNVNSKHCILNISPNARRERGEESSWTLQTKPNLIHLRFSWCKHYRSPPLNLNKIPKIVSAIIWEYFPEHDAIRVLLMSEVSCVCHKLFGLVVWFRSCSCQVNLIVRLRN